MAVANTSSARISLPAAARQTELTAQGLLKILRRTGKAIRDDGRWYADPAVVDQVTAARQFLGLASNRRNKA
jgi:hypothetical protein